MGEAGAWALLVPADVRDARDRLEKEIRNAWRPEGGKDTAQVGVEGSPRVLMPVSEIEATELEMRSLRETGNCGMPKR